MGSNYERAQQLLEQRNPETFLGYSAGGLLDRIDAQQIRRQTINAPHQNYLQRTTFPFLRLRTGSEGLSPYHVALSSLR
jgi:hypothetical protein